MFYQSFWYLTPKLLQAVHSEVFWLGFLPPTISKTIKKLVRHILTAARCLVMLLWKIREPPSLIELYARIKDMELMETLTVCLNNTLNKHNGVQELLHLTEEPQ